MTHEMIALLRQIPIYPKWGSVPNRRNLATECPLCEDDKGKIAFVSAEAKRKWINRMYAVEQRRKQKGEITPTSKQNRPEVPNFRSQSVLEE